MCLGFGVWGLGLEVWGLGFGVWGLGFGVWGLASHGSRAGVRSRIGVAASVRRHLPMAAGFKLGSWV